MNLLKSQWILYFSVVLQLSVLKKLLTLISLENEKKVFLKVLKIFITSNILSLFYRQYKKRHAFKDIIVKEGTEN